MKIRGLIIAIAVLPLAACQLSFGEDEKPAADKCAEPKAAADRLMTDDDDTNDVIAYRVIINDRGCFEAELVAMAQELLARETGQGGTATPSLLAP